MAKSAPNYEVFTYWDAFFLVGALVTYIVDLALDVVVSSTYFYDGYYTYGLINFGMVLFPSIFVQIFSIRWFQLDSMMKDSYWFIHAALMGVVQRYLMVLKIGFEAMKSGDPIDYQRFYQQQSDVCMLRLFDSFAESAPQLVFHLYVMILRSSWPIEQAAWTGTSAVVSMVSLGWGIAAYSAALRMTREDKQKLSWTGMILQTFWRVGMLSARLAALIMLALALQHWTFIVMFVHWILMTGWVLTQNTDFCRTQWEERLYNAVVGIIYCFCFFNLKEGKSRYRMAIFYSVVVVENFCFVVAFYYLGGFEDGVRYWMSVSGFLIVACGTILGLIGMLLYYRFFHPAGPIKPWTGESVDFVIDLDLKKSPDFVTYDASGDIAREVAKLEARQRKAAAAGVGVRHSRSFKSGCHQPRREPRPRMNSSTSDIGPSISASPVSTNRVIRSSGMIVGPQGTMAQDRIDSTYGTDSNRTVSPQESKPEPGHSISNTSSQSIAFNNQTYASVDSTGQKGQDMEDKPDVSYASVGPKTPKSHQRKVSDETYMSIHPGNDNSRSNEPEVLLKRSPIVRDVTTAQISSTAKLTQVDTSSSSGYKSLGSIPGAGKNLFREPEKPPIKETRQNDKKPGEKLTAPLTIIVPNISRAFARHSRSRSGDEADKTISMEVLNPKSQDLSQLSAHDYENMALININRASFAKGIAHWRTYSDMADNKHDDSIAAERKKNKDYSNYNSLHYFDIYPLSKEIKDQLYRSLTPVSTAATVATSDDGILTTFTDSDTYEPIENYQDFFARATGCTNEETKKHDSLNDTYGELKVPVPVTLIHHDGTRLTTRQIVSMESLREVIRKHEKVPMDDPQDRGDLYLLAPMRLLLSPIAEEHEVSEAQSHATENGTDFNRSLMTVISELLTTSNRSFLHSTALPQHHHLTNTGHITQPNMTTNNPDGHYQDSVDSASSLVNIIDEIRNNSLCNLLYMTGSSGDINTNCEQDLSHHKLPQQEPECPRPVNQPSPAKTRPQHQKSSPLYTSVGSRKNLLELAGISAESAILNTPKKAIPGKLAVPLPKASPPEIKRSGYYQPGQAATETHRSSTHGLPTFTGQRPKVEERKSLDSAQQHQRFVARPMPTWPSQIQPASHASSSARPAELQHNRCDQQASINVRSNQSGTGHPDSVLLSQPFPDLRNTSGAFEQNHSLAKPFGDLRNGSVAYSSPVHQPKSFQFPALSPSAKYTTDNTPTPPLRQNQFVRRTTNPSKVSRRKFSIIRDQFESPEVRRKNSENDLYENVSNDLLASSGLENRDRCKSVPCVFPDLELRADEKYESFGHQFENRSQWSTASFQKPQPSYIGNRNTHDRRSMSIISESSVKNGYPLPPKKQTHANKENLVPNGFKPLDRAPAIPPRVSTRINPGAQSSPKARGFSKLI